MTNPNPIPVNQQCPSCSALVFYEGHVDDSRELNQHRFHCHRCNSVYHLTSTSHKPPKYTIKSRHLIRDIEPPEIAHSEHEEDDDEQESQTAHETSNQIENPNESETD